MLAVATIENTLSPSEAVSAYSCTAQAQPAQTVDKAILAEAKSTLLKRITQDLDPAVYGTAVKNTEGKWKPVFANTKEGPLKRFNAALNRYEMRRLTGSQVERHLQGVVPRFMANVANRLRLVWHEDRLIELLFSIPDSFATEQMREAAVSRVGEKPFSITPAQALEYLGRDPAGRRSHCIPKWLINDTAFPFVRWLLSIPKGTERNRLRRAINQAIRGELDEIRDHEIVIDIDAANKADPTAAACSRVLAQTIAEEVLRPLGFAMIEVSRNGRGAYIRFRVTRASDPQSFNDFLKLFQSELKARFNSPGAGAKVDKVGGRLSWLEPNPDFDPDTFWSHEPWQSDQNAMMRGERYRWQKSHAGLEVHGRVVHWTYDGSMEEYVRRGSDLITYVCHGLGRDSDGGIERLGDYKRLLRAPAIPESKLRGLFPDDSAIRQDGLPAKSITVPPPVKTPSCPPPERASSPVALPSGFTAGNKNWNILRDARCGSQQRYAAAARLALSHSNGDKGLALASALQLVEHPEGPASGVRHPARVARMQQCIQHASQTFIPKGSRSCAKSLWTQSMLSAVEVHLRAFLTLDDLESANGKYGHANFEMLAATFFVYLDFINRGRPVSQSLVKSALKAKGHCHGRSTLAAARKLLIASPCPLLIKTRSHKNFGVEKRGAVFALAPQFPRQLLPDTNATSATHSARTERLNAIKSSPRQGFAPHRVEGTQLFQQSGQSGSKPSHGVPPQQPLSHKNVSCERESDGELHQVVPQNLSMNTITSAIPAQFW